MFPHALSLSGVPSGVLDLTADLAPLFSGLVVGLGLCVLALAVVTAIHDTWWAQRKAKTETTEPASLSKAA